MSDPQSPACEECRGPIEISDFEKRGGRMLKPRRFCSTKCRNLFHNRLASIRRQLKAGNAVVSEVASQRGYRLHPKLECADEK